MLYNNTPKYTQDVDSALLAFSVLRKLGAGNVKTFEERLRSQKIQYLAQVFSVSPAYNFSLYIHGPYSPGLANDLFMIEEQKLKPDLSDFIPDILNERFGRLSAFIKAKDNRWLELVSTVHLFVKRLGYSEAKSAKELRNWKKASEKEVEESFIALKQIP
ncbi:MAG: hypothetical protein WCT02_01025 [Candidatus Paceibacterota bacterium]|jgi:uncharacterized protein YwgA